MPCPRTQQANLPACSQQPPINAEHQAGKLQIPYFKVFWYDSTRGLNPRSTDCEVDALTTMPSCRDSCKLPLCSTTFKLYYLAFCKMNQQRFFKSLAASNNQAHFLSTNQGKQDLTRNSRNLGRNRAAMCNPL